MTRFDKHNLIKTFKRSLTNRPWHELWSFQTTAIPSCCPDTDEPLSVW